jgi:predicted PurR-regulated permease PerM
MTVLVAILLCALIALNVVEFLNNLIIYGRNYKTNERTIRILEKEKNDLEQERVKLDNYIKWLEKEGKIKDMIIKSSDKTVYVVRNKMSDLYEILDSSKYEMVEKNQG